MDSASRARLKLVYPDFAVRARRVFEDMRHVTGMTMRMLEGIRSFDRQKERYAIGRTVPGKCVCPKHPIGRTVTNAQPGMSWHHYGVADDWIFSGDDPYLEKLAASGDNGKKKAAFLWEQYARLCEAHGLVNGGRWKTIVDFPHKELAYGGMRVQDAFELYRQGGIVAVWSEFDRIRGVRPGAEWYGPSPQSVLLERGQLAWQRFRENSGVFV